MRLVFTTGSPDSFNMQLRVLEVEREGDKIEIIRDDIKNLNNCGSFVV